MLPQSMASQVESAPPVRPQNATAFAQQSRESMHASSQKQLPPSPPHSQAEQLFKSSGQSAQLQLSSPASQMPLPQTIPPLVVVVGPGPVVVVVVGPFVGPGPTLSVPP